MKKKKAIRKSAKDLKPISQTAFARTMNVTDRTVRNWILRDGMPVNPDGTVNPLEAKAWKAMQEETREQKGQDSDGKGREHWELEYRKAKALLADIELKKKTGELLEKKSVEEKTIFKILAVKSALLSLPKFLPPQLEGLDRAGIADVLRLRIEEIINDFAK